MERERALWCLLPLPIRWGEGNRTVMLLFQSTRNSEETLFYFVAFGTISQW